MSNRDDLRQALAISPDNVPLLLLYAEACLEDLVPDEALRAFERVLELAPQHAAASLGMARVLFLTGRSSEAAVRVESLLAREPESTQALQLYARILLGEGDREQARSFYTRARSLPGFIPDAELDREFGSKPSGGATKVPVDAASGSAGDRSRSPTHLGGDRSEEDGAIGAAPEMERPPLGFDNVGGMEDVKQTFRMKVLYPMRNPDLYRAYGKTPGGGVLLYGPPGCGKTLLSRACAGEMGAAFASIGLHQILDMWLGNSEKQLHAIFETARRRAPCILFFDEIDALAADRIHLRHSAGRSLINQFLAEVDSGSEQNDGVLVIGATNAPWHLDHAFLRPGRFDRVLFVPPPDEAARGAIIEILARDRPVSEIDPKRLARKTRDFSGADLKNVFDLATERCLEEALQKGRVVPLTAQSLEKAAADVRPSTKAWFETARNYALYSNQSGLYDDILVYLGIEKK